jgi:hypothetical protein
MDKKVSFSGRNQDLDVMNTYFDNVKKSIDLYFSVKNPNIIEIFGGTTSKDEIENQRKITLKEHEYLVTLNLLAAIEAAFRVDYLQRCYNRKKDKLSQAFREIYQSKGKHASLEDDIFITWKQNMDLPNNIISDLKAAFKYRHWLAHGRYWEPKFGKKYDYVSIFTLAQIVFDFPFEKI